jgi:hypothetical protein
LMKWFMDDEYNFGERFVVTAPLTLVTLSLNIELRSLTSPSILSRPMSLTVKGAANKRVLMYLLKHRSMSESLTFTTIINAPSYDVIPTVKLSVRQQCMLKELVIMKGNVGNITNAIEFPRLQRLTANVMDVVGMLTGQPSLKETLTSIRIRIPRHSCSEIQRARVTELLGASISLCFDPVNVLGF